MFDEIVALIALIIAGLSVAGFFAYAYLTKRQLSEISDYFEDLRREAKNNQNKADKELDQEVNRAYAIAFKHARTMINKII